MYGGLRERNMVGVIITNRSLQNDFVHSLAKCERKNFDIIVFIYCIVKTPKNSGANIVIITCDLYITTNCTFAKLCLMSNMHKMH